MQELIALNARLQSKWDDMVSLRVQSLSHLTGPTPIPTAIEQIILSLEKGNKILIFGNGGSATQSSHFAAELVNKFYFERGPLPAIALSADYANLTCIANDSHYQFIFSRQIEALGKPGDIAIGLTTSGKSPNILQALEKARTMKLITIAICGNQTNDLEKINPDVLIKTPSNDTPTIQEMHLFILHFMAQILEQYFFSITNASKQGS